jgi:pyrroloquinoline quinone biosynthesis protein B
VAFSADGERWFLLNASPEIRSQIEAFAPLHPRAARHSPIAAILLTNGDLDHCLGLLSLRESYPLTVCATDEVRRGFTEGNVLYRTLERFPGQLTWKRFDADLDERLAVQAIAAPGKPPLHLEGSAPATAGENVGLIIRNRATGKRLVYFSAAAGVTPAMRAAIDGADCLFFDGTFWSSDELIALGLGTRRAEEMAHLPVASSLELLSGCRAKRKIYIHINNTNPILDRASPERRRVEAAGWELAHDGMEITLQ